MFDKFLLTSLFCSCYNSINVLLVRLVFPNALWLFLIFSAGETGLWQVRCDHVASTLTQQRTAGLGLIYSLEGEPTKKLALFCPTIFVFKP